MWRWAGVETKKVVEWSISFAKNYGRGDYVQVFLLYSDILDSSMNLQRMERYCQNISRAFTVMCVNYFDLT
jgi:hypothetical protein